MWSRSQLKTNAKLVLSRCYWQAFSVALIITAIMGNMDKVNFLLSGTDMDTFMNEARSFIIYDLAEFDVFGLLLILPTAAKTVFSITLGIIALLCVRIFIGIPFVVGAARFFTEADSGNDNLNNIAFTFHSGKYNNVVFVMFLRALYTFLWGLLFIIPGVVKLYSYSMIPYIMADNPGVDAKRAFKISEMMTRGHKWDMFVLDLSFIGWYILGIFAFGVGVVFVEPYYLATKAGLYITLRNEMFSSPQSRPVYYGEETKNIAEITEKEPVNE